jgi:hypothetical protein
VTRRPDFVSGNTRLRARIPALHQLDDLQRPRDREQVARRLLRDVPGAYPPQAAAVVEVLLARQDLRDVVALLRGAVRGHPAAMRRRAVRAVGRVSETRAADVAEAGDGADAVRRLTIHRLPDPTLVSVLHHAYTAYELHGDLHELETTIASETHLAWRRALSHAGPGAHAVLALVTAERDMANLRTVLQVGGLDRVGLLPYGRLGAPELTATLRGDWTPLSRARPDWGRVLTTLGARPSAAVVELALSGLITGRAGSLLRFGDVYTAEPAVGYVLAVESTARRPGLDLSTGGPTASHPAREETAWVSSS